MRSFKSLAETAVGSTDRWYVSDGATAVGPVGLDLIARGIEEGKVPLESYVRHEAWRVWRPVWELTEARVPRAADSAAPTPPYRHRRPDADTLMPTDDITLPGRPVLPDEIAPGDALEGAADMADALHLLLNAAVLHLHADTALLHRTNEQHAVVHYAHGPFARTMIGVETGFTDPVMAIARMGTVIIAEPSPGPAGQALVDRLLLLGVLCDAATMHPILVSGRLIAVLEVGRKGTALRVSEVVILEQLVDAFVSRTEAGIWH
jgi:hypothetical protein